MLIEPIGYVESPYLTKSGVPRQPGLVKGVHSRLVLCKDIYPDAACPGAKEGDWIVLLWSFSHNIRERGAWSKTVRPPILGGTQRVGVFATRSSFRPNSLALSCVQICRHRDRDIEFRGGDMVSGTPVYGIYPYRESAYCARDASGGWPSDHLWPSLKELVLADTAQIDLEGCNMKALTDFLLQDPRPAHTRTGQEAREFWTAYDEWLIWYEVHGAALHVTRAAHLNGEDIEYVLLTGRLPNKYCN